MAEPSKYLEESWRKRSDEAQAKVLKAIKELQANGEPVNFNTVHLKSGESKSYLYTNETVRKGIESQRLLEAAKAGAWHKNMTAFYKSFHPHQTLYLADGSHINSNSLYHAFLLSIMSLMRSVYSSPSFPR